MMGHLLVWLLACSTDPSARADGVGVQAVAPPEPIPMMPADIRARRVPLLARMTQDPDPAVRGDVAAALGFTAHDTESIPAFAAALEAEPDPTVQLTLAAVLLSFRGRVAIDPVVRFWLRRPDSSIEADVRSGLLGADPREVRASLDALGALAPDRAEALRVALY